MINQFRKMEIPKSCHPTTRSHLYWIGFDFRKNSNEAKGDREHERRQTHNPFPAFDLVLANSVAE